MASEKASARDLVWTAIMAKGADGNSFTVDQLTRWIALETDHDPPSDETVRRTLRAGSELGTIRHKSGSPRYSLGDDFTARSVL